MAPFAVGLALWYFFASFVVDFRVLEDEPGYAPSVTSHVLLALSAVAYAVASSLAAWEGGRLRRDGVWRLAPARSRYRVAVHQLIPVVLLGWTMLALPVVLGLVREGVAPTAGSLVLPLLAMTVLSAHVVIGFAVAWVVPRLVAAPVLAVVVFYAVAAAWSYEPFWLRHVCGQFPTGLGFGELPTPISLLPHLLFTGSIALGLALLWLSARRVVTVVLACVVTLAGTSTAYAISRDWGHTPPLDRGNVAERCVGQRPAVCMPEATAAPLPQIRREAAQVLDRLDDAGVRVRRPESVVDTFGYGPNPPASTDETWYAPLTSSHRAGTTRVALLHEAVDLPCRLTGNLASRSATLWAASVVGVDGAYRERLRTELRQFPDGREMLAAVRARVAEVRHMTPAQQARWYHAELRRACASPATGDPGSR